MRIGIMGGTFDPIHLAHLIIAEEARTRLELEEVVFVPAGQPWLRSGEAPAPAKQRVEMVRLAVQDNPFFRVSTVEMDRPGPTYTVDTLEEMRRELGDNAELFFILGMDSMKDFHRWKEPARILELCTLVAMVRPGHGDFQRDSLLAIAPTALARVRFLNSLRVEISGTEIRRRAAQGLSIRYMAPGAVEEYIRRTGLYRIGAVVSQG